MYLTQKIRIFPTPAQEQVLWELSENCRLIYNFALKERIDAWRNNGESIVYVKQAKDLPQLKKQYPRYKSNNSKTLQSTLKKLDQDYKSFFALWKNGYTDARPPRYKGKDHFTTLVYNQSGFKISNNLFGRFIKMAQTSNNNKAQKSLNYSTQNTGTLNRFVGFLTYKAQKIGKRVIEINEKDTTKTCCVCGKKHNMKLHNRVMTCDCGNNLDRDRNSAINIMVRYLSQNALVDGLDTFVSNLRKTGLPIGNALAGSPCL